MKHTQHYNIAIIFTTAFCLRNKISLWIIITTVQIKIPYHPVTKGSKGVHALLRICRSKNRNPAEILRYRYALNIYPSIIYFIYYAYLKPQYFLSNAFISSISCSQQLIGIGLSSLPSMTGLKRKSKGMRKLRACGSLLLSSNEPFQHRESHKKTKERHSHDKHALRNIIKMTESPQLLIDRLIRNHRHSSKEHQSGACNR